MDVKSRQEQNFTTSEQEISEIGKLMAHPARVRILGLLLEHGVMGSSEIATHVPLARTTVLQHITALKDGNWLETTTDGSAIKYHINNKIFNRISKVLNPFFSQCGTMRSIDKSPPFKILFLCTGNSCRSQMAEGFINTFSAEYNVKAYSAGTKPAKEVKPEAIAVMAEKDIDISGHYPKPAKDFIGDKTIDLVVLVCKQAEEECPYLFPFSKHKIFIPFIDPETKEEFREVRDQIEIRLRHLLEEL